MGGIEGGKELGRVYKSVWRFGDYVQQELTLKKMKELKLLEAPTAYPQEVEVVAKPRLACPSWNKVTATAFLPFGDLPRPRFRT